ncbi:MAG: hypothetical protein ACU0B7_05310 [Paracoccaceae bacterium]|uniref:hypothetical protein n=1 Tax=Seohaeicola saemankumensis TaxID=481181 RepID=UPI001E53A264|nr:hypothetical protein [Seohaeicola saemankumensis]MCD1626566.1 hypothetical protein [Seohaeicola saemankumensis]
MPAANPDLMPYSTKPRAQHGGRVILTAVLLASGFGMAACTHFPEMGDRLTQAEENQTFPKLVPVETLLAGVEPENLQPDTKDTLEDRIAALNSRADGLRAAGMDDDTRDRMQRGVTLTDD